MERSLMNQQEIILETAIDINAWNHDPSTNPNDPNLILWKEVFEPAGFSWGNDYSDSINRILSDMLNKVVDYITKT